LSDADYSEELDILENELIDQYLENALPQEERIQVERHFLKTPERNDKLTFTKALHQASKARIFEKRRIVRPPAQKKTSSAWALLSPAYLKAAAIVLLVAGLGLGGWRLLTRRSAEDQGMADLRAAYKNQRLTETRITNLDYAPMAKTRGQERPNIDEASRRRAELLLLEALNDHPDAKTHHSLGRLYLAGLRYDDAVEQLETALKQDPTNPLIYSDLGAALLEIGERAESKDEPGKAFASLAKSLEYINAALKLKPDLLEALYNKALCLQHMNLPAQEEEAWRNYLTHDSQSKWAEEAKGHLQAISGQSVSSLTAPQLLNGFIDAFHAGDDSRAWGILSRNREIITGKMITAQLERQYISEAQKGQEEGAQESLRAFFFAGQLESERAGDPYTSDLSHFYAAASSRQRHWLAEALENIDEGYRLCLAANYGHAAERFKAARSLFFIARDEWETELAEYWISYCYTQLDNIKESIALLKDVAAFCESGGYKWLGAQAHEWLGVNFFTLSEYSNAIKHHQQSLALAEAISDPYQIQKALSALGDQYAYLRQPQLSLEYHYRSLSLAAKTASSPRQSWRNLLFTTEALFTFKYYEAAAAAANEALELGSKKIDDPALNYMLRLELGQIYSKLGRFDEAIDQSRLGLEIARSLDDRTASQKFIAAAFLNQAHVWREAQNYEQAIRYYNQAIGLYEGMELDLHRYAAYKGRLQCSLAVKDESGIQRDLPLVLQLSERYRFQIREEQNRDTFFDTEQSVYDIAIEYEHQKQNDLKALNYAEAAHARSLLDALHAGAHLEKTATGPDVVSYHVYQPSDSENVLQRIPAEIEIVMYSILPTKLLIWSISQEGLSVHEQPIPAARLEKDVESFASSLTASGGGSKHAASETSMKLYETLLKPVEDTLKSGRKLCIIPDKFLYRVPFAALMSPETGRYLIEDWAVFYAPSLNVLWRCTEEAKKKARQPERAILSIGNPSFDRRAYPDLPTLKEAEREAREIASLFERPTCLVGPDASKGNALRTIRNAELIHFAGHYLVDPSNPLLSRMLLAGQNSDTFDEQDSVLSGAEILERRFDRAKLIVLSACQTGLDRYYDGEGAVGLSRTFIAAGIPQVVASLWPVDSEGTADLMISFYRHRRAGGPTAEALRQAQIDMLRNADKKYQSPYYWAAFLCIGSCTEY
jgi:CHAT domain-containing protein